MRRIIGFIVLLAVIGSARGQTTYSYRYWFDNNPATLQTGSAQGETAIEIDISKLAKGSIHALHLQGHSDGEEWSPTRTTYFFVKEESSESVTARYWYDNDETTVQTAPTVNGLIDLDISHLDIGTHAVHYQTFNATGEASPVHTTNFYMNELQRATLSCQIWIDDEEDKAQTFNLTDGDIVIEAEDLSIGMHDLHAVLYESNGKWLAEGTTTFEVKAPMATITLTAWIETFSFGKDLDFSGVKGLRAYTATGFHRLTGDVMMSRVSDVPAGEGLLLVGDPGTYEVPVLTSYSYYANLLVGTSEAIEIAQNDNGYYNYLLSFRDGEATFSLAEDGSTLAAGKAYLHIPDNGAAGARKLKISFDDNPDGIVSPVKETEGGAAYYNLVGQRMSKPQKGIYIKDGKKILR